MQVGIKISPARNDNHCEFGCWHKCCRLGGLAAEAETSVCPVPAVSAAAGKLAAAAMPPAIRTLRREVRAGIWSFNSGSSWLVCVDSQTFPATSLRQRLNRFKL